jgi:hypothetical protein
MKPSAGKPVFPQNQTGFGRKGITDSGNVTAATAATAASTQITKDAITEIKMINGTPVRIVKKVIKPPTRYPPPRNNIVAPVKPTVKNINFGPLKPSTEITVNEPLKAVKTAVKTTTTVKTVQQKLIKQSLRIPQKTKSVSTNSSANQKTVNPVKLTSSKSIPKKITTNHSEISSCVLDLRDPRDHPEYANRIKEIELNTGLKVKII